MFRRQIKRLRRRLERIRGVVTGDVLQGGSRKGGVIAIPRAGSSQLYFVYTGGAKKLGVDPRLFFKRTGLFERNVALFRDEHNAFYMNGLSASIDSFDALLAWHHDFRARLPQVKRVFCIGTSMGAYAAILFGHLLKAERVWAFGPPVTILDEFPEAPAERTDLARLLGTPNGVTAYDVHFSEGCAPDVEAASRIAACQGVRLIPHPGSDHDLVKTLLARGVLDKILPDPD